MTNGKLTYVILKLQRDCNPRRKPKHKTNKFKRKKIGSIKK